MARIAVDVDVVSAHLAAILQTVNAAGEGFGGEPLVGAVTPVTQPFVSTVNRQVLLIDRAVYTSIRDLVNLRTAMAATLKVLAQADGDAAANAVALEAILTETAELDEDAKEQQASGTTDTDDEEEA